MLKILATFIVIALTNVSFVFGEESLFFPDVTLDKQDFALDTENLARIKGPSGKIIARDPKGLVPGLVLAGLKPGSSLAKWGFQDGDIIYKVNSDWVTKPAQLGKYVANLNNERIVFLVERDGARTSFPVSYLKILP